MSEHLSLFYEAILTPAFTQRRAHTFEEDLDHLQKIGHRLCGSCHRV